MPEMIINIRDIPPEGRHLTLPFDRAWFLQAMQGVDVELGDAPAGADIDVHLVGDNVMVTGRMTGDATVPCGRCLAPAHVDLSSKIHMTYSRDAELGDAELENPDEDVDFATFEGEEIDLGELFREQILLAIPMTPLCRQECKGLCSQCGKDLNEGPCSCEGPKKDSPFDALKGIKLS